MSRPHPPGSRLFELAADRATIGLDAGEAAELDALLRGAGPAQLREIEELELAAASVHLAFLSSEEGPPAGMAERLRRDAQVALSLPPPEVAPPARPWFASARAGWLAAAAVLVVAIGPKLLPARRAPSADELLQGLVESASDLLQAEWAPGPDLLGEQVSGTLVWSPARQEGYMRFARLPRNDPEELQYQLWIFDARREDPPVDGGVFDIGADGEVVVPIHAKLEVFEPHLFAITAEAPGGVVVSGRERVVALASQS